MKQTRPILPILLLLAHCSAARAQTPDDPPSLFYGLPGVEVGIEDLAADAERDGLHREALQAAVEAKLRAAGIRVLTAEEASETPRWPYLYVQVRTMKHLDMDVYAYTVDVSLQEAVMLGGSVDGLMVFAKTWVKQPSVLGMMGPAFLPAVTDIVLMEIEGFIDEFRRANPKR